MLRTRCGLVALFLGYGGVCCHAADFSWFFTISNEVSPEQPSTTLTLWASFDPQWYAFGLSKPEVRSAEDPGGFADPQVLIQQWMYCDPGDVAPDGDSVDGTYLQQYHLLLGQFADTDNPLELWSVTWTTNDFKRRDVPIWTESKEFFVYIDGWGTWDDFYGPEFSEALGVIQIVPAPSGVAVMIAAGALTFGRRRK